MLIINYLRVIKGICYALFSSTNWKMLLHMFFIFCKEILTVMALFDYSIRYSFFFFLKSTNVAFIGSMNFRGKMTNHWVVIERWLVHNINRFWIYSFLSGKFISYYFISIKLFNDTSRQISCDLIFPWTFFFIRNLYTLCHSKNL